MFDDNSLLNAQQLLEENEDLIAVMVENIQLGRLDDCIKYYSILQKNLVTMTLALDNYPAENLDPYETLSSFPDEIMRKDVLDELQPPGDTVIPKAPLPPCCQKCAEQNISTEKCRIELDHVDFSSKFSELEKIEFFRVTQVLEVRNRQKKLEIAKGKSESGLRRTYRRWTPYERYTLCIAMSLFGPKAYKKIASVLGDRNDDSVRSFIFKTFNHAMKIDICSGKLPKPPKNYEPPRTLLANPDFLLAHPEYVILAADTNFPPSQIAPKQGCSDWASLLGIATGIEQNKPSSSSNNNSNSKPPHTTTSTDQDHDSTSSQPPPPSSTATLASTAITPTNGAGTYLFEKKNKRAHMKRIILEDVDGLFDDVSYSTRRNKDQMVINNNNNNGNNNIVSNPNHLLELSNTANCSSYANSSLAPSNYLNRWEYEASTAAAPSAISTATGEGTLHSDTTTTPTPTTTAISTTTGIQQQQLSVSIRSSQPAAPHVFLPPLPRPRLPPIPAETMRVPIPDTNLLNAATSTTTATKISSDMTLESPPPCSVLGYSTGTTSGTTTEIQHVDKQNKNKVKNKKLSKKELRELSALGEISPQQIMLLPSSSTVNKRQTKTNETKHPKVLKVSKKRRKADEEVNGSSTGNTNGSSSSMHGDLQRHPLTDHHPPAMTPTTSTTPLANSNPTMTTSNSNPNNLLYVTAYKNKVNIDPTDITGNKPPRKRRKALQDSSIPSSYQNQQQYDVAAAAPSSSTTIMSSQWSSSIPVDARFDFHSGSSLATSSSTSMPSLANHSNIWNSNSSFISAGKYSQRNKPQKVDKSSKLNKKNNRRNTTNTGGNDLDPVTEQQPETSRNNNTVISSENYCNNNISNDFNRNEDSFGSHYDLLSCYPVDDDFDFNNMSKMSENFDLSIVNNNIMLSDDFSML